MPELPEVETIARQLKMRGIEGRKILSVKVDWERTVEPLSAAAFSGKIRGTTIERISRTGKWLLFSLSSGQTIMIHLRMSGGFSMEAGLHDRLVLQLSDGLTLHYRDTRKFGRWKLVDDAEHILGALGPDALTRRFNLDYFCRAMHKHHRKIKPVILDQSIIAGLGNIYADEALWEARIHPERLSDSLDNAELEELFKAIKHVLNAGVRNRGTSLGEGKTNYRDVDGKSGGHRERVKVYSRTGEPCDRCSTPINKCVVAGRGTHYCPSCQRCGITAVQNK